MIRIEISGQKNHTYRNELDVYREVNLMLTLISVLLREKLVFIDHFNIKPLDDDAYFKSLIKRNNLRMIL